MSDISIIPLQDGFETQLSQDWDGAVGTVYVLATPSYTPTTSNTYIVVNPGKTNMQIAEVTSYDSTAKTLTVSSISFEKGLGIPSTQQTHSTGSKVIISDNYQYWEDIQTSVNSKLDKDGGNVLTFADATARDTALGGDGVAIKSYRVYLETGVFTNYNLNTGQWETEDVGTPPGNATDITSGLVRTDVAPVGIPVALITDNPKYDALAGTAGTPSNTNRYVTDEDRTGGNSPAGVVLPFAGASAPTGFLLCDGDAVSRTTYSALFAIISTTYGVGDGSTTFNVPNLKGRVPVGLNSSETEFDTLGETGGAKTHTLTVDQIPAHTHNITLHNGGSPVANAQSAGTNNVGSVNSASTGGGGSHNNIQPYITLNYIIKT